MPFVLGGDSKLEGRDFLLASSISKIFASICTYPHEVIRTRVQNSSRETGKPARILPLIARIAREEGVRGFYRGMGTNLLRVVPGGAITVSTYEIISKHLEVFVITGEEHTL